MIIPPSVDVVDPRSSGRADGPELVRVEELVYNCVEGSQFSVDWRAQRAVLGVSVLPTLRLDASNR